MKKWFIILLAMLTLSMLGGCVDEIMADINASKSSREPLEIQNQVEDNEIQNNTEKEKLSNEAKNNSGNIVVYVDKNCKDSAIPQCNTKSLKELFIRNLNGTQVDVLYTNDKINKEINKLKQTTPLLVIPEDKLSAFGTQAEGIKQTAQKIGNKYYIPLYGWIAGEENLCNDGKDNNNDGKIDAKDPSCFKMDVLSSSKCKKSYCKPEIFKNMFIGYSINVIDINTAKGKQIYNNLLKLNTKQYFPTFLFNKKKNYIDTLKLYLKEHKNFEYKYQLEIPQFKYNPSIETCDTNCNSSPACKKLLTCNKSYKPKVELFVMSYCPFGTQAEKGILPVVNLLKNKIDFKVKFVNYAMHGKKEIDENNLQYCIQKEEPTKYNTYLSCFLKAGNQKDCIKKSNLNERKINICIENVKKQFKTEENYNNKAMWLNGRFPQYEVYDDLNKKYGIQGSPTLIINGIKVESGRSPQAYLSTICKAFKYPPKECKKQISNQAYDPMWGWTQNGRKAPEGSCGN